jgi:predicted PurR-regulated permease PerM
MPETDSKPQAPPETQAPAAQAPAAHRCNFQEDRSGFPTHFARLFFGVITLIVIYYTYLILKPYLMNLFLALVLFFTARPLYSGLCRVFFGRRVIASALTCLILALVILVPLFTLMSIIANQAMELSARVSAGLMDGHIWQWVVVKTDALKAYLAHLNLPLPTGDIDLKNIVQTVVTKASAFIYTNAVGLVKGFTIFFFDLLLVLFIAFFMFMQGDEFIAALKSLSPLDTAHNDEIVRETEATIKATLWGSVIVAVVQGTLGGIGFWIFGLSQPAFWGTVMIPAAILPVVGSAVIWGPAAVYLMFTGHLGAGIGLVLWGGVLVSVIDNVLKPMLIKGAGSTPTIFILFSVLGGITYFGMIGFILGPLILSFLLSLLRIYQKTILAPAMEAAAAAEVEPPPAQKCM